MLAEQVTSRLVLRSEPVVALWLAWSAEAVRVSGQFGTLCSKKMPNSPQC